MNAESKAFLLENIPSAVDYSRVHGGELYTGVYGNQSATHAVIIDSHCAVKDCLQEYFDDSEIGDNPLDTLKSIDIIYKSKKRIPDLLFNNKGYDINLNSNVVGIYCIFY